MVESVPGQKTEWTIQNIQNLLPSESGLMRKYIATLVLWGVLVEEMKLLLSNPQKMNSGVAAEMIPKVPGNSRPIPPPSEPHRIFFLFIRHIYLSQLFSQIRVLLDFLLVKLPW